MVQKGNKNRTKKKKGPLPLAIATCLESEGNPPLTSAAAVEV
jgi:hypothetical protein